MKPEIEAKFLNVNHDEIRAKLTELGAECVQPMRLMKRKVYDFVDDHLSRERSGWVRVRDEGNKITMSYKQLNNRLLDGTYEVSLIVDDFRMADDFLKQIGLEEKSYQETKRESWRFDTFEIELDEWPWLKPYIEFEGPDEQSLKNLAIKLGLNWLDACHGSVEVVYRGEYDVSDEEFDAIDHITFNDPIPNILMSRKLQ